MLTRDFLNLKVWDLHMENKPVETYPIHDYLRTKLCVLYENDCIFDKFECCWSPRDECVLPSPLSVSLSNVSSFQSSVDRFLSQFVQNQLASELQRDDVRIVAWTSDSASTNAPRKESSSGRSSKSSRWNQRREFRILEENSPLCLSSDRRSARHCHCT